MRSASHEVSGGGNRTTSAPCGKPTTRTTQTSNTHNAVVTRAAPNKSEQGTEHTRLSQQITRIDAYGVAIAFQS